MKLVIINSSGEKDITQMVQKITWSGDYQQVARKLEFAVAGSSDDYYLPDIDISPGNTVQFYEDGTLLFDGFVFTKEGSHNSHLLSITAYDGGIYLLKNEGAYNFKSTTAESIATMVCNDFGIPVGQFVTTGIVQSLLCVGDNLYSIIMKAYTKAAQQNGKKYMPIMAGGKLHVIERGSLALNNVLSSGKEVMDSTYSESIENMVNTVKIVDKVGSTSNEVLQWSEDE